MEDPTLDGYIQEMTSDLVPTNPTKSVQPFTQLTGGYDPFHRLPAELIGMVFQNMSTEGVYNLRIASRAAAMTSLSTSFWRSRFWPGMQFDFFAPLIPRIKNSNYRALYFRLCKDGSDARLRNRSRIWQLAMGIINLLRIVSSTTPTWTGLSPNSTAPLCLPGFTSVLPEESQDDGCRQLRHVDALFPTTNTSIRAVGVSFVVVAGQRLVSGLRIFFREATTVQVGYYHNGSEILLFACGFQSEHAKFSGFQVALDNHGMRAVAFNTSKDLEWAGDPIGSRGMVFPTIGLRVGLDVRSPHRVVTWRANAEVEPAFP